jgi:hypothetical protein
VEQCGNLILLKACHPIKGVIDIERIYELRKKSEQKKSIRQQS